ncbi:hypothetical protein Q5P01_016531 [Channa striata]|uniref:Uncharacterized protein n=1 Tax=Channa striata TaxID=64152 RepID=A0AA88MGV7_CHASR|nr:hypothetical protein Q5P01_016531 [Channa striata]
MLQPKLYVVQPQVQNTLLLAEAAATSLQGKVQGNGIQTVPAQGMMLQHQRVISSGQAQGPGMLLVEMSRIQGAGSNLKQAGKISGSQTVMIVKDEVPAASVKMGAGVWWSTPPLICQKPPPCFHQLTFTQELLLATGLYRFT